MFNIARISDWRQYPFLCWWGKCPELLRCPGHKKDLAESTATLCFFHKVAMPHLFIIVRYSLISSTTSGFKSVLVSPRLLISFTRNLAQNTSP